MDRNFLMIRSVAFAFVTKLSGGATVFVSLPVISHGMPPGEYATFLTTMNVTAAVGLISFPFGAIYIRELAHAFASGDAQLTKAAIRDTFGSHATLTAAILLGLVVGVLAMWSVTAFSSAIVLGLGLTLLQNGASWGQFYRIANRSDHVTSVIQTVSNIMMVLCLVALSRTHHLSAISASATYFGVPALAELFNLLQLLCTRRFELSIDKRAVHAFRVRVPLAFPLYLSPVADYIKIYASSILVLFAAGRYDYLIFSTSILLLGRLVNPITLITRPLMPAYIDAIHRDDVVWLSGLRKVLFWGAVSGAVVAALIPFFINQAALSIFLPKEAHGVSIAYVVCSSYFAFAYTVIALLSPLYVGVHRALFYGVSNLAFTIGGALCGMLFSVWFGALGMMGSLALTAMACGVFLLASIRWPESASLPKGKWIGSR